MIDQPETEAPPEPSPQVAPRELKKRLRAFVIGVGLGAAMVGGATVIRVRRLEHQVEVVAEKVLDLQVLLEAESTVAPDNPVSEGDPVVPEVPE